MEGNRAHVDTLITRLTDAGCNVYPLTASGPERDKMIRALHPDAVVYLPMGPALVSLAAGDLSSMAYNMQVAFATTVVGMLIAAIGVVTLQVKQRWCAREMNELEYIYQLRHEKKD